MLPPRKVQFEAQKRENENLRIRTFLKCNADEEKLDRQFKSVPLESYGNGKQHVLYNPKAAGNLALNFAFPFEKILV